MTLQTLCTSCALRLVCLRVQQSLVNTPACLVALMWYGVMYTLCMVRCHATLCPAWHHVELRAVVQAIGCPVVQSDGVSVQFVGKHALRACNEGCVVQPIGRQAQLCMALPVMLSWSVVGAGSPVTAAYLP